jgi:outer membrane protein OmpU
MDKQGAFGVGESYAIGNVTLMGDFTYTQIKALGQSQSCRWAKAVRTGR